MSLEIFGDGRIKRNGANSVFIGSGDLNITGNVLIGGTVTNGPAIISTITGTVSLDSTSLGMTYVCTGTSSDYAVTLPSATGNAGKTITFIMSSALTKLVTITAAESSTIDGSTTRIMWARESATLITDGTNWYKISGKTIPMQAGQYKNGTDQAMANSTAVKIVLGTAVFSNCPSAMNDTTNNRLTVVRPGIYNFIASARFKNVSAAGGYEVLGYRNGSEIIIMSRYMTIGDWGAVEAIYSYSFAVGDNVELYGRQYSGSTQNTFASIGNSIFLTEIPNW